VGRVPGGGGAPPPPPPGGGGVPTTFNYTLFLPSVFVSI
jgi:hypothetical protein